MKSFLIAHSNVPNCKRVKQLGPLHATWSVKLSKA